MPIRIRSKNLAWLHEEHEKLNAKDTEIAPREQIAAA